MEKYQKEKTASQIILKQNLQLHIRKSNLSLHQLARKTGLNKSSLHNYLNGVLPQGLLALVKLSQYFNVSLDDLILETKSTPTQTLLHQEEIYEVTIKKIR